MDRTERTPWRRPHAFALLLLIAVSNVGAQSPRGSRQERALRRSETIYLKLDERRLVARALVERIRCERGVLIVRPLGGSALVYCDLHPRPSVHIAL